MFAKDITIPSAKVGKMGDFTALNVYWDNRDDDEPRIFKEEKELKDANLGSPRK